jgi:hypothetical protein
VGFLLDRYARGDCVQVWTEMLGMGAFLRSDPDGWAEAQAVAALMTQRARENAERLRGDFTIGLAPDYLHKANVSGGAPYSMVMPNPAVDGLLLWNGTRPRS